MSPCKIRVFLPGAGSFTASMLQSGIKSPDSISHSPPKHCHYGWDPDPIEIKDKIPTDSFGAMITGFYLTIRFYLICSRCGSLQVEWEKETPMLLIERGLTVICLVLHNM